MPPLTFGQSLRQARERADLSQVALARRAGMTAPYLSLLESGRRRPPSPARVERLARGLSLDPTPWLELAALERSPAPVRRRVEALDRERGGLGRARDRILTTTLFRVAHTPGLLDAVGDGGEADLPFLGLLRRLAGRLSGVRSAREAQTRSEEILARVSPKEREDLLEALPGVLSGPPGAPPAPGGPEVGRLDVRAGLEPDARVLDTLCVDPRWAPPGAFLWRLSSDEAWPRLESGDLLAIDPTRSPQPGDLVALRHQGQDLVRRLERQGPDGVRLASLRGDQPPLRLAAAAFAPVGVVVCSLRSLA